MTWRDFHVQNQSSIFCSCVLLFKTDSSYDNYVSIISV